MVVLKGKDIRDIDILNNYERWIKFINKDEDVKQELKELADSSDKLYDAFYKNLSFGTGGLRGIIGAGTNRMNIYTVGKASQGLSNYINKNFQKEKRKIAVSYDSREKSELFAKTACCIFAANGIKAEIYKELMPTPCLSYAVRKLGCAAGIMITASHNPAEYNGYKVYGADGCQITTDAAEKILVEIEQLDIFKDIQEIDFQEGILQGKICYIENHVYDSYIEEVKQQSLVKGNLKINQDITIVYTPLNGTGLKPILRVLKESGYKKIYVVEEQKNPDGRFPTCPYPNPENKEAMGLGLKMAKEKQADLLLATDPDCDRVGIAVQRNEEDYVLLSGNETGLLLFDYICSRRRENGFMPDNPVMVKTIVTTDMAEQIAENYGVQTINVLTGFKFIGEQIGKLEEKGKVDSYIFGFEESYGYLSGSYVRDKDAVNASFLICEMYAYYKANGINLLDKLEELYLRYGFCLNTLYSYECKGAAGFEKMQEIMEEMRVGVGIFGTKQVKECLDYKNGLGGLPKSDVLKFILEDNCSVVIRPSGTEPKLKVYVSVSALDREKAEEETKKIEKSLKEYIICK